MGWKVWGKEYAAGELSNNVIGQPVKINQDTVLIGCRIWLIFYDNPTFTSLRMRINDKDNFVAISLNVPTKAQIITLANGCKEIFFNFDKINLKRNTEYTFVLRGVGYSPTGGAHISWRYNYPDPVYDHKSTISFVSMPSNPLTLTLIGSDEE